jgi:hypothetical protein
VPELYALAVEIFFVSMVGALLISAYIFDVHTILLPVNPLVLTFLIPAIALLLTWEIRPELIRSRFRKDEKPRLGSGVS